MPSAASEVTIMRTNFVTVLAALGSITPPATRVQQAVRASGVAGALQESGSSAIETSPSLRARASEPRLGTLTETLGGVSAVLGTLLGLAETTGPAVIASAGTIVAAERGVAVANALDGGVARDSGTPATVTIGHLVLPEVVLASRGSVSIASAITDSANSMAVAITFASRGGAELIDEGVTIAVLATNVKLVSAAAEVKVLDNTRVRGEFVCVLILSPEGDSRDLDDGGRVLGGG
jgi:hypothetical protein